MLNTALTVSVCLSLGLAVFTGIYTLFRSQSAKKNYFILMQASVIVYLTGYLLELTSTNTGEAYTAVKLLYMGGAFAPVFTFFFACDYCNKKIHPVFGKIPLLLLALFQVLSMWTNGFHRLVYTDYSFQITAFHRLGFTAGPLYPVINSFSSAVMVLTILVLLYQITKWKNLYRRQLFILLACVCIPFLSECVYLGITITGLYKTRLYLTPFSMTAMTLCLYLRVIRLNIFEIIPAATVTAMDHIREGFILLDHSGNYLSSNAAAVKIIPGISGLAKGEPVFSADGWPGELDSPEAESVEFAMHGDSTRYYRAGISPVTGKNQALIAKIIIFREITDSVKLMKRLENAAYIDALTGIYNRKHFSELAAVNIERALRKNQPVYAVMLDLDFFKNVNDTYGHAAGDAVLKATAGIVRQTIRSYDLLGRYGGEEFVLLITDLAPREAYKLMERIRENMERSAISYKDQKITVTCSIGLAELDGGSDLETAIRKADEALYAAKHSGRNLVKVYGAL